MGGGDPSQINTIDTIQIGTLGNAVDFGDLTVGRAYLGVTSNGTRGVFAGGNSPNKNEIDFVTITSAGNATDFGDLSVARTTVDACSDGHGGLRAFNPRTPELYSPTGKVVSNGFGQGQIGIFNGGEIGGSGTNMTDFITISTL